VSVPPGLEWWREEPGGAKWLDRLPGLIAECAEQWRLGVGEPFHDAHISWVAPADLPDGTRGVLKINFPERESEREPDALAHWGGIGAVRLLLSDPERRALVVERCEPGVRLWERPDGDETLRIAADVLRTLWRPAPARHAYRLVAEVVAAWVVELPATWERAGRPFERELLDEAVAFLRERGPTQGEAVVVHQDFHCGNVLEATREPWLAIDPKPLVGERAFDTSSLLRDRRWELRNDPDPVGRVRRRLDLLAAELDLDREAMRGWGIAHALGWGLSDRGADADMVACARWLAAA
jgi:streptomycin 6-kinase